MTPGHNQLVDALPAFERRQLVNVAEPFPLEMHAEIFAPGASTLYALFPVRGLLSMVVQLDDAPGLEVGLVGNEGMVGLPLVLGASTMPWRVLVQGPGMALRVLREPFEKLLQDCPLLHRALLQYANAVLSQTAALAACNHFHSVQQRLSRWLLMTQDRAQADTFQMTQEFLAYMLGVRRVSITQSASTLQAAQLIAYHRGSITVLDRAGLEGMACHCYRQTQNAFLSQHLADDGPLGTGTQ